MSERDWDALHERYEEARRETLEKTMAELLPTLTNDEGLARLEGITLEEWEAAVELDEEEERKAAQASLQEGVEPETDRNSDGK